MIRILVVDPRPVHRLLAGTRGQLPLAVHHYVDVLRTGRILSGHLIFTDFDRLGRAEIEATARLAAAAAGFDPRLRILNRPGHVAERFELLARLRRAGLSPVEATRIDGDPPTRYPVFIRVEDGASGPETGLLNDELSYQSALRDLRARGLSVKRRIAVTFDAEPSADGYYRKYGAFRIGDHIIPQHVMRSRDWVVKSSRSERTEAFAQEELAYCETNPDEAMVRAAFKASDIDFGRIDYGFAKGRAVVFEINTNPSFPMFGGLGHPLREARRPLLLSRLVEAFSALDRQPVRPGLIRFEPLPRESWRKRRRRVKRRAREVLSILPWLVRG